MRVRACGFALVVAGLLACGSSDFSPPDDAGSTPETGDPIDAGQDGRAEDARPDVPYPAPHAPLPQVQTANGPVLKAPKIVAIGFAGDTNLPVARDFVAKLAADSSLWSSATSQYGVGAIASATVLTVDSTPPTTIDDTQVRLWLGTQLDASADGGAAGADGGVVLPPADADTIYVIFYPGTTSVTLGGQTNCAGFDGYHGDFTHGSADVTYAVVTACPPAGGLLPQELFTATFSHELMEAATDPLPYTQPAWVGTTSNGIAWQFLGPGGEIGDMCEQFMDSYYTPPSFPYEFQKVWSNRDAVASHDPCQPQGKTPYFNAAPVLPDQILVQLPTGLSAVPAPGIKIAVGQSRTLELDLFSDGPMAPWNVAALDLGYQLYGKPLLSFSFDAISGQNGDKVNMTITVVAAGPTGTEPFWIQNNAPSATTYWPAVVGN